MNEREEAREQFNLAEADEKLALKAFEQGDIKKFDKHLWKGFEHLLLSLKEVKKTKSPFPHA